MRFIACYYPFDIPCKLDDVEEIYINVLVLVIIAHCLLISLVSSEKVTNQTS